MNMLMVLSEYERENTIDIEITISDTGIGIRDDEVEAIFSPFRQQYGQNRKKYGGTGLGLSICQQILTMHSGKIWVESKLNEGSKFSFLLPIKSS